MPTKYLIFRILCGFRFDEKKNDLEVIRLRYRYVQLPADRVDTQLLQDASRKEAAAQTRK